MGRGLVVLHTPDSFLARFRVQVWSGFRRWISTVLVCVFHCLRGLGVLGVGFRGQVLVQGSGL